MVRAPARASPPSTDFGKGEGKANISRFRAELKDIFLSGKNTITKNYLRFLVDEIVATDERVEITLNPRSALALMSSEARKEESEAVFMPPIQYSLQEWIGSGRRA